MLDDICIKFRLKYVEKYLNTRKSGKRERRQNLCCILSQVHDPVACKGPLGWKVRTMPNFVTFGSSEFAAFSREPVLFPPLRRTTGSNFPGPLTSFNPSSTLSLSLSLSPSLSLSLSLSVTAWEMEGGSWSCWRNSKSPFFWRSIS